MYIIITDDDPRDVAWDVFEGDKLVKGIEFGYYRRPGIYYEMVYVESPGTFSLILYLRSESAGNSKFRVPAFGPL
jgi:hypothetical protein